MVSCRILIGKNGFFNKSIA